jgi:peptidoglycan/LPS O-acetylase OafA/YrhL
MLTIGATVGWPEGYTAEGISFALLRNLAVWLMILVLIGLADRYLNKPSKVLDVLNRASYPVYIVHQTVLLAAAYFIVILDVSWVVKFAAIVLTAVGLSWGCYEICRRFKVTRFLMGIK